MSRLTILHKEGLLVNEGGYYEPDKSNYMDITNKLGQLENLEDKLGCPLDVVFKALKEGVSYNREDVARTYNVKEWLDFATRPRLYYSDDWECWCWELFLGGYVLQLKDYGKTWWLKGDKNYD